MVRDDIVEYSLDYHHNEEQGKKVRKKIYFVTVLLSVVTIVEVLVGIYWSKTVVSPGVWTAIKVGYLVLTIVKAGYIVLVFMHLGDEQKSLKYMILAPYVLFILYLFFILATEASYIHNIWNTFH